MKKYVYLDCEYELIKDYKNGFDNDEINKRITDYFKDYDYIIGDWSYGKLRLKGFCDEKNSKFRDINDFKKKDEYIKNNCAYECRYFILKRINP